MSHNITYASIDRMVENDDEFNSLLDISIANQIPHLHECGGHGQCTTCRVRILEGNNNLSPKNQVERETAFARRWDPSIRLACQAYPKGDVTLQRLVWSMGEVNQLQKELAPEGKAEERPIAILFCDLQNYSSLANDTGRFNAANMLNRYYTALGEPILMNNGIIYQYVGEEIVGVFGTTGGTREKICMDAIRAALGMQSALKQLNSMDFPELETELKSGIGVNFGRAFIGHLGHPTHKQFSVIGDPVKVASQIQQESKKTNTRILISKSVLNGVSADKILLGQTISFLQSGKEQKSELFEILGFKDLDLQLELQASLHMMLEDQDYFAKTFYDKVFEIAPGVRSLFRNNMTDQGRLLTHMLGGIVYSLSRPEHLKTGLKRLGQNHENYGVRDNHYPIIKEAMLFAIDNILGPRKTERTMDAWSAALDYVSDSMKNWKQL